MKRARQMYRPPQFTMAWYWRPTRIDSAWAPSIQYDVGDVLTYLGHRLRVVHATSTVRADGYSRELRSTRQHRQKSGENSTPAPMTETLKSGA